MEEFSPEFRQKVLEVYENLFPELHSHTVVVGYTGSGMLLGCAYSWHDPPKINLRPNVEYHVIIHEFIHILQGMGIGIPHGEKACDIWAMVRSWPEKYLDMEPSYLMSCNSFEWHRIRHKVRELCIKAIEVRKWNRQYIVWLERKIEDLRRQTKNEMMIVYP